MMMRASWSGTNTLPCAQAKSTFPASKHSSKAVTVWYGSFPCIGTAALPLLKEWEDLVLTYGWAYGTHGDALKGKELMLAVSVGSAGENYHHEGEFGYTVDELLAPFKATSNLIGTVYRKPFILTGVSSGMSDQNLEKAAKDYLSRLQDDWPAQ